MLAGFGIFSAVQFTFAQTANDALPSSSPGITVDQTSAPSPMPSAVSKPVTSVVPSPLVTDESTPPNAQADPMVINGSYLATKTCESDGKLSYEQAVTAHANGRLNIAFTPNQANYRITAKVENLTDCPVPLSLGIYKLFGPYSPETLSSQQYYFGTATIIVDAGSSSTFEAIAPDCMFQADIWYGDVQRILVDNRVYGEFLAGDQYRLDEYCVRSQTAPSSTPLITITPTPTPPITDSGIRGTTTPPIASTAPTATPPPSGGEGPVSLSGSRSRPIVLASAPTTLVQSGPFYFPTLPDAGFAPFGEGPINDVMPYAIPMFIMIVIGMLRIPFIRYDAN